MGRVLDCSPGDLMDAIDDIVCGKKSVAVKEGLSPTYEVLKAIFFGEQNSSNHLLFGNFEFGCRWCGHGGPIQDSVNLTVNLLMMV